MNIVASKILNKEELTSEEVGQIINYGYDDIEVVEEIEGKDRRWSRTNKVIIAIGNQYFSLTYEHGLTEYQDDEYYSQIAVEVEKKEVVTKTIVWEEKSE